MDWDKFVDRAVDVVMVMGLTIIICFFGVGLFAIIAMLVS